MRIRHLSVGLYLARSNLLLVVSVVIMGLVVMCVTKEIVLVPFIE